MNLVYGEIVDLGMIDGMRHGTVRVGGAMKKIALDLIEDAQCGDIVLLCDGVAIAKANEAETAKENYVSGDSR